MFQQWIYTKIQREVAVLSGRGLGLCAGPGETGHRPALQEVGGTGGDLHESTKDLTILGDTINAFFGRY